MKTLYSQVINNKIKKINKLLKNFNNRLMNNWKLKNKFKNP